MAVPMIAMPGSSELADGRRILDIRLRAARRREASRVAKVYLALCGVCYCLVLGVVELRDFWQLPPVEILLLLGAMFWRRSVRLVGNALEMMPPPRRRNRGASRVQGPFNIFTCRWVHGGVAVGVVAAFYVIFNIPPVTRPWWLALFLAVVRVVGSTVGGVVWLRLTPLVSPQPLRISLRFNR